MATQALHSSILALHRLPRPDRQRNETHQLQLVNVIYENEKKKPHSGYRRSVSRRHSMIEDSEYSVEPNNKYYSADPNNKYYSADPNNKYYSTDPNNKSNLRQTKPITMQTSRLSVFLQQHKDPPGPNNQPAYPKTAPCSMHTFSSPFSQGSPNIRRTRNDDEYYGGFGRSNSVRRSAREGRTDSAKNFYPQEHRQHDNNCRSTHHETKNSYHQEDKPAYQQENKHSFHQEGNRRFNNQENKPLYHQENKQAYNQESRPAYPHENKYQQEIKSSHHHDNNCKAGYVPETRGQDSRPGYLQDTITSIRRSKERSQTHTDSPSRFRRTPSNRSRPAAPISQSSRQATSNKNLKQSPVRMHKETPSMKETGHTHHCALSRTPSCKSSLGEQVAKKEADNTSILSRHGSVRVPSSSYTRQNSGLLRSFSLRKKGPEDFLHTSSMPCLADPVLRAGPLSSFGKDKNSNYFSSSGRSTAEKMKQQHQESSPASPSLVMNSLAYQVLPEQVTFQRGRSRNREHNYNHTPLAQTGSYGSTGSTSYSSSHSSASSSLSLHSPPSPVQTRKRPVTDDSDGHLAYLPGDFVSDRYEVLSTLGEGTFGKVVKVKDHENNDYVAMKIIKNIHKYREAAKLEINVLNKLNNKDPSGQHLCVRMFDSFNYFGHMCLTFEILGESVFDFLKGNGYVGYPLDQVRHIAYQLSYAVKFLHDNHLTHTDLKPENILFVSSDWYSEYCPLTKRTIRRMRDTRVKLIDFGSATFDWEHHSSVVSTRHYRPPEVILELGWSHPCDIWSTGCIIFELYQGHTLFQTHDNLEHLAMMSRILGDLPAHIVRRSRSTLFNQGRLTWDWNSQGARYANQHCRPLPQYRRHDRSSAIGMEESAMLDMVARMLEYDPDRRITLKDAIKHPFFDSLSVYQKLEEVSKHILRLQI